MKKYVLFCAAIFIAQAHLHAKKKEIKPIGHMLLLDTQGHPNHYYRNLTLLCESVGLNVTYQNFFKYLERPKFDDFQTIMIVLGPNIMNRANSELGRKFFNSVATLCQQPHKHIALFFAGNTKFVQPFLIKQCKLFEDTQHGDQLEYMLPLIFNAVLKKDIHTGKLFGSTLVNKADTSPPQLAIKSGQRVTQFIDKENNLTVASLLPLYGKHLDPKAQQLIPHALLIKKSSTNSLFLIGKTSDITFSEITENFVKAPIHLHNRTKLLRAIQQTLFEWLHAIQKQSAAPTVSDPLPPLPYQLTPSYSMQEKQKAEHVIKNALTQSKKYNWMNNKISCAWMFPGDFFLQESLKSAKGTEKDRLLKKLKGTLPKGMRMIADSGFNLLWLPYCPEVYFSPVAIQKKELPQITKEITQFAQALKKEYRKRKAPLPKVFIGTNITSNFRIHKPKHPAVDMFGKTYPNIPCALDIKTYWKQEVIEPFKQFYNTFNKTLPVTGIWFDFEMYHAQQQASGYTESMGFSDFIWNQYAKTHNTPKLSTASERVNFLIKRKKLKYYFDFLTQKAKDLGIYLKKELRTTAPDLQFAGYAPTLPSSWFYRGIIAGLSSPQEPLIYATFNTEYYSHHNWLTKQNMHLLHGSVLLLSKLANQEDFELITNILNYHYFIWFNQPSRMLYGYKKLKRKKQWWAVEASDMQLKQLSNGIKLHTKH